MNHRELLSEVEVVECELFDEGMFDTIKSKVSGIGKAIDKKLQKPIELASKKITLKIMKLNPEKRIMMINGIGKAYIFIKGKTLLKLSSPDGKIISRILGPVLGFLEGFVLSLIGGSMVGRGVGEIASGKAPIGLLRLLAGLIVVSFGSLADSTFKDPDIYDKLDGKVQKEIDKFMKNVKDSGFDKRDNTKYKDVTNESEYDMENFEKVISEVILEMLEEGDESLVKLMMETEKSHSGDGEVVKEDFINETVSMLKSNLGLIEEEVEVVEEDSVLTEEIDKMKSLWSFDEKE